MLYHRRRTTENLTIYIYINIDDRLFLPKKFKKIIISYAYFACLRYVCVQFIRFNVYDVNETLKYL